MNKTFNIFFIGIYIRLLGAFPIPEVYGLGSIVKPVKKALDNHWFVHFFPEGDMILHDHELQPFHEGIFSLAIMFNKPVIPITIVTIKRKFFGRELPDRFQKIAVIVSGTLYPDDFINSDLKNKKEAARIMSDEAKKIMSGLIGEQLSLYI